jgi:hypothetical protein
MGLKDELAQLREKLELREPWKVPVTTLLVCKEHERAQALMAGHPPPPYTPEEREEMYRHDVELVSGGADRHRLVPGWQSASGQEMIDRWEALARRRLERLGNGEDFRAVYEDYNYDERSGGSLDELLSEYTEED